MQRTERDPPLQRSDLRARGRLAGAQLLAAWVRREAMALDPACFSLVMATGIVSNSLFLQGHRPASDVLAALALVAYAWLCLLTAWRATGAAAAMRSELLSPRYVFSFFTFVAASDVVGLAFELRGFNSLALFMWLIAIVSWIALIYLGFGVLMFLNTREGADVADGAWLNAIVAIQSLVILGTRSVLPTTNAGGTVSILIYALWTVGLWLYAIYVTLLCQRMFFRALKPADVGPLLWVVMGAAAISANAGIALATADSGVPFLQAMQSFVNGAMLAMWARASWWIPLLLLLGIWKHGIRRVPIAYTPMLWSIVFPIGMYAATSWRLAGLANLPGLAAWSAAVSWMALAAWSAAATALAVASFGSLRMLEWQDGRAPDL